MTNRLLPSRYADKSADGFVVRDARGKRPSTVVLTTPKLSKPNSYRRPSPPHPVNMLQWAVVSSSARSYLAPPYISIDKCLPLHGCRYFKAIFAVYGWMLPDQRNCTVLIAFEHQKMSEDCGPSSAVERPDFDFPPIAHSRSMERSSAKSKGELARSSRGPVVVLYCYDLFAVETLEGQKTRQTALSWCDTGNFHSAAAGGAHVKLTGLIFRHAP